MATLEVLNISLPASNIIMKPIDSIELRTKSLQADANKRKAIWLNFFSFNWLHIDLLVAPRRFDNGLGKEHGLRKKTTKITFHPDMTSSWWAMLIKYSYLKHSSTAVFFVNRMCHLIFRWHLSKLGETYSLKYIAVVLFLFILKDDIWCQHPFDCQGVVLLFFKHDMWVFPKIGVPQNGCFIMENPIKIDDLGVPPFSETPICSYATIMSSIGAEFLKLKNLPTSATTMTGHLLSHLPYSAHTLAKSFGLPLTVNAQVCRGCKSFATIMNSVMNICIDIIKLCR